MREFFTAWELYRAAIENMAHDNSLHARDQVQALGMAFHHNHWVDRHDELRDLVQARFPGNKAVKDDNLNKLFGMELLCQIKDELCS